MRKVHIGRFYKITLIGDIIQDLEVNNRNLSYMIHNKMKVGLMMNLMKIIWGINLLIRRNKSRIIKRIGFMKKTMKITTTMGKTIKVITM